MPKASESFNHIPPNSSDLQILEQLNADIECIMQGASFEDELTEANVSTFERGDTRL